MVYFTNGLRTRDIQNTTADKFRQRLRDKWGCHQLYELIKRKDQEVLPYFDRDDKISLSVMTDPKQRDPILESNLQGCLGRLESFAKEYLPPDFDFHKHLVSLKRHGELPGGKEFKVSFRFYILGCRVQMWKMKQMIKDLCQDDWWDTSPYHATSQKLGVPGGFKDIDNDKRLLDVFGNGDQEIMRAQAVSAVAQIVDVDWPLIGADVVDVEETRSAKRIKQDDFSEGFAHPGPWEEVVVVLESVGFVGPYIAWKGLSKPDSITFDSSNHGQGGCPCCKQQHTRNNWYICKTSDRRYFIKNWSEKCSSMIIGAPVTGPMESDVEEIVVCNQTFPQARLADWGLTSPMESYMDDATGKQCWMVHQHLESCPSCAKQHVSDRWLIERMVESCYTFRNSEPSCKARGVFRKGRLGTPQEYIYQIVESPHSESPFVKLFLAKHGEHIISNGVSLYKFDNTIWRKMADNVAALAMQEFFEELLPALLALVHAEDHCVRPHNSQFKDKDVKYLRKQLCTAIGHTRSQTGINNLVKNMKIQAFVDQLEEEFDKNPNLLAFDDGVLDLRNSEFRPGRAEDMITKTVGYSFNKVAQATIAEVEAFMERLYPVEEERHVAQLFGGYCMFGRHPEKVLLMLTDDGGERSGHNGKSSFAKALAAALGPHAVKGKNPFLYKAEFNAETANSHNAGDLFYLGKRVAYWEELDPSRRLNDGKLKDLNGGCAMYNFRGCNMKEEFQAEWGCKMIMCFNRSNMPQLDFTDGALVDRLLVLQHRSRFIKSVEAYEEFQLVPNTFPAIDLDDRLVEWRPAIARWLLAGHERWRQVGFTHLPQQCREFTEALVGEQDTVKVFADEHLVSTASDSDHITQAMAYERFLLVTPEERVKKTALGRNRFYDQLRKHLPDKFHKQKRVAGEVIKNAYIRCKLLE